MIIVTGTKRSGTSMWMQILIAAGFPNIGEAFPMRWEQTIKAANPEGFYESHFRRGIYYRTNPHPKTGAYLFPEQVQRHAVKVFVPGLVRSDRSYIDKVIATVRPWREYEASIARLYAMEDDFHRSTGKSELIPQERMPGALEWWVDNYMLIRDIAVRRHSVHVQSYDGLLSEPERVIHDVLTWLGHGDAKKAITAVKPQLRTQHQPIATTVEPEIAEVFDNFYAAIHAGKGLEATLLQQLNDTNEILAPRIQAIQLRLQEQARQRQEQRTKLRQESIAKGQPLPEAPEITSHDEDEGVD